MSDTISGHSKSAIVMLTDFGAESFYVGAMKGAVLAVAPDATIVDLTHSIRPYAVEEASFVLARVFGLFAERTVFVAVVDPGVGRARKDLVFKSHGRYLVGPDNGIVSDIAMEFGVDSVFAISDEAVSKIRKHRGLGRTFLGRDVFAPAAAFLANGGPIGYLGHRVEEYESITLPSIEIGKGYVRGFGRYVDSFGNILTNISGSVLNEVFGDTPLAKIRVAINNTVGIDGIEEYFSRGEIGELMAILDSWNLLEISVNQGRAVDRFPDARRFEIELTLT